MKNMIDEQISCDHDFAGFDQCMVQKNRFLLATRYFKLREDYDYGALCRILKSDAERDHLRERGRIFYLSVSPKLYPYITQYITEHCLEDMVHEADFLPYVKIVYEKPFGEDMASSQALFRHIQETLDLLVNDRTDMRDLLNSIYDQVSLN